MEIHIECSSSESEWPGPGEGRVPSESSDSWASLRFKFSGSLVTVPGRPRTTRPDPIRAWLPYVTQDARPGLTGTCNLRVAVRRRAVSDSWCRRA